MSESHVCLTWPFGCSGQTYGSLMYPPNLKNFANKSFHSDGYAAGYFSRYTSAINRSASAAVILPAIWSARIFNLRTFRSISSCDIGASPCAVSCLSWSITGGLALISRMFSIRSASLGKNLHRFLACRNAAANSVEETSSSLSRSNQSSASMLIDLPLCPASG